jgi:demethylmenaquinone methyltransferase/2-methoxy-6-polyprenyl-1,4-benzoquinol methylase
VSERPGAGAIKSDHDVRRMFGRIVRRYDLMNRLMTGGQDERWRKKAVRYARAAGSDAALDVATGTGDLALALAGGGFRRVVGLDFAPEMIAAAEAKGRGCDGVEFLVGDAMALPFPDGTFDAVTVSFGLRNIRDYGGALREMARVLRPAGRLVCLELTPYRKPVLGRIFNAYFSRVVPMVGGWLSGDAEAYRYLPSSVAAFPDAVALAELMRQSGFARVEIERVGGGTVAIHVAVRPDAH